MAYEMNCTHCRHMLRDGPQAVCRRNPPLPFPVPTRTALGDPAMSVIALWPPVADTDVCGEFNFGGATKPSPGAHTSRRIGIVK